MDILKEDYESYEEKEPKWKLKYGQQQYVFISTNPYRTSGDIHTVSCKEYIEHVPILALLALKLDTRFESVTWDIHTMVHSIEIVKRELYVYQLDKTFYKGEYSSKTYPAEYIELQIMLDKLQNMKRRVLNTRTN